MLYLSDAIHTHTHNTVGPGKKIGQLQMVITVR